MLARDYRHAAADKMKGNWGTLILTTIIVAVITGLLGFTVIGTLLVGGAFTVGANIVYLKVSRGEDARLENVFDGFRYSYLNSLVGYILVLLFTALWSLLFVIPGIIKAIAYSQTFYILADHPDMSGNEAITESQRIMQGNKWRFFCLQFSFLGWILLSACTFGILLIWVVPYIQMANVQFYESIKDQGMASQPEQEVDATVMDEEE